MKTYPKLIRTLTTQSDKITANELTTTTHMHNDKGAKLTIGDLTLEQLQLCLFLAMKDQHITDKNIVKAFTALAHVVTP